MHIPAPSPMMKPSRSASKGRLARCGSSLRVDSARIAAKPPTPIGVIAASEPPAIMMSASPRRMISNDSPMAWADAVQAVHVARLGPRALKRIETWPAARLMIDAGMKNGEIRRGGERELDEDVHLLDVFLVDELERVEALHLAGDPRREVQRVEPRDRPDA